jgi:hypothetical protein
VANTAAEGILLNANKMIITYPAFFETFLIVVETFATGSCSRHGVFQKMAPIQVVPCITNLILKRKATSFVKLVYNACACLHGPNARQSDSNYNGASSEAVVLGRADARIHTIST